MSLNISSSEDYVYVAETEFTDTLKNVSYGIVKRPVNSVEDVLVSTKTPKLFNREKCLLFTTVLQSVLLLIAIICVAVTYSKCNEVKEGLNNIPESEALKRCNQSCLYWRVPSAFLN